MKFKIKGISIYIEETIFFTLILMCLFMNINEYLSSYIMCYLFIMFHEFAHILVANIFNISITKVEFRTLGMCAKLDNFNRNGLKWICIFLAGPLANLLLSIIFRSNIMIMSINIAMMLINLMPIYPLDGYNILTIIIDGININNKFKLQRNIEKITYVLIMLIGIIQLVKYGNPSIFLLAIYAYIQSKTAEQNNTKIMYQKYYKNITNF